MKQAFLAYQCFFKLKSYLVLLIFLYSSLKAQNESPYAVFGHTSSVNYNLNIEQLLYIKNEDCSSAVRALAYDFNHQTVFLLGEHDSILGVKHITPGEILRFLSVDPLLRNFPYYSPYQFCSNTPIMAIELEGLETSNQINKSEFGMGFGVSLSPATRGSKHTLDVKFNLFGYYGNSNIQTSAGINWGNTDLNLNVSAVIPYSLNASIDKNWTPSGSVTTGNTSYTLPNTSSSEPILQVAMKNQHIGLSLKTNLSYKGATKINLIQKSQILTSNPDDINKIGYNESGTNLLSFNLAPSLVSDKHIEREVQATNQAKINQLTAHRRTEERKKWSPYTRELNKITAFTYKGELHVYRGQQNLPEPIDKGLRTFGKPIIGALKKM